MGHYAILDKDNIVISVFVGKDETDKTMDWEAHYSEILGQTCKRTSFNTFANKHSEGKTPFRYNYAGAGFKFDPEVLPEGAFIPPSPFPSWILDKNTYSWQAPIQKPDEKQFYIWDEENKNWKLSLLIKTKEE
jgi:hypothetical protein